MFVSHRSFAVALFILSIAVPESRRAAGASASPPRDFADPFVFVDDAAYVAFATGARGAHIQAARSSDLLTWTNLPDALPDLPTWASPEPGRTWAPSVLRTAQGYVLYYTTRDRASGYQCIGRATSPRATGPYIDDTTRPFLCSVDACGAIDASPFVDDGGAMWLLWKSDDNNAACHRATRIWSERLTDDGLALTGARAALIGSDRAWEGPLVEGPSMIRDGEIYYLFYSANNYESADYAIGYATCASPAGPCRKMTTAAPLFASRGALLGPGGQEFFRDLRGQRWIAYHAWTAPLATYAAGGARSLHLAPLAIDHGVPHLIGDPAP